MDQYNTNANLNEWYLTPDSVKPGGGFGQLWWAATDGSPIYAEPLYYPQLAVQFNGVLQNRDTVFVATSLNNVFAIDAVTGAVIWTTAVQRPTHGGQVSFIPNVDIGGYPGDPWGVTSTPTIDPVFLTLFVESTSREITATVNHYYHMLWKLDLATGAVLASTIIAEETATCDVPGDMCVPLAFPSGPRITSVSPDSEGGIVYFQVLRQLQRTGLHLVDGIVIFGFSGYDDISPWQGWIVGYAHDTMAQVIQFCTAPSGDAAGVWGAGYKLPLDSDGFIYASLGNGNFNADPGNFDAGGFPIDGALHGAGVEVVFDALHSSLHSMPPSAGDYGGGVMKLAVDPTITPDSGYKNGWGLRVVDWWVPWNNNVLSSTAVDLDTGSTGVTLIPDGTVPSRPKLLVVCGKDEILYVLDRTNLGHFNPTRNNIVFELPLNAPTINFTGVFNGAWQGTPYFNGNLYQVISNGPGYQVTLSPADGSLALKNMNNDVPNIVFGYTNGMPFITASGSANGLLWTLTSPLDDGTGFNGLRIYRAADFTLVHAITVYNLMSKFSTPTVVDGVCYFGTHAGVLYAFGLPGGEPSPPPPVSPSSTASPSPPASASATAAAPAPTDSGGGGGHSSPSLAPAAPSTVAPRASGSAPLATGANATPTHAAAHSSNGTTADAAVATQPLLGTAGTVGVAVGAAVVAVGAVAAALLVRRAHARTTTTAATAAAAAAAARAGPSRGSAATTAAACAVPPPPPAAGGAGSNATAMQLISPAGGSGVAVPRNVC